jgi:hypothetical protein
MGECVGIEWRAFTIVGCVKEIKRPERRVLAAECEPSRAIDGGSPYDKGRSVRQWSAADPRAELQRHPGKTRSAGPVAATNIFTIGAASGARTSRWHQTDLLRGRCAKPGRPRWLMPKQSFMREFGSGCERHEGRDDDVDWDTPAWRIGLTSSCRVILSRVGPQRWD